MDVGKCGLKTSVIAAISFVLVLLGQVEAILLVFAYAVFLEKNDWLIKQTISAFVLYLSYALLKLVITRFLRLLIDIFTSLKVYKAVEVFTKSSSFLQYILEIALIVFVVLSIINVLKRKDVKIPFLKVVFDGKLSKAFSKSSSIATSQYYQQPMTSPQNYQQSVSIPQDYTESAQGEPHNTKPLSKDSLALEDDSPKKQSENRNTWQCPCGTTNTGKFCINCGNKQK